MTAFLIGWLWLFGGWGWVYAFSRDGTELTLVGKGAVLVLWPVMQLVSVLGMAQERWMRLGMTEASPSSRADS